MAAAAAAGRGASSVQAGCQGPKQTDSQLETMPLMRMFWTPPRRASIWWMPSRWTSYSDRSPFPTCGASAGRGGRHGTARTDRVVEQDQNGADDLVAGALDGGVETGVDEAEGLGLEAEGEAGVGGDGADAGEVDGGDEEGGVVEGRVVDGVGEPGQPGGGAGAAVLELDEPGDELVHDFCVGRPSVAAEQKAETGPTVVDQRLARHPGRGLGQGEERVDGAQVLGPDVGDGGAGGGGAQEGTGRDAGEQEREGLVGVGVGVVDVRLRPRLRLRASQGLDSRVAKDEHGGGCAATGEGIGRDGSARARGGEQEPRRG